MGSKGNQVKTEQTYTPNPAIGQAGTQAINMATNAANQPFQQPVAPVAGFNPFQEQAFGQIQGMQGMSQPYFDLGQQYLQGSAAPVSGQDVANYYNPMADNVTRQMQNIFGQQNLQNTGSLTQAAGGVGADRIAVGQANMANQQGLAAGQTYSQLYQQALQAAQQQKQMMAGAGYGIAQMGPAAQSAYLQGTGALGQAGGQQQAQTQAELNAPYQNELAKLAYPFQTAQYLSGITGGLSGAMGGTTNTVKTTPTPSPLSQALGVGLAGAGMFMGIPPGLSMGMGSALGGMGGGKGSGVGGGGDPNSYARGGNVDPYDFGHGFAGGGDPTSDLSYPMSDPSSIYPTGIYDPAPDAGYMRNAPGISKDVADYTSMGQTAPPVVSTEEDLRTVPGPGEDPTSGIGNFPGNPSLRRAIASPEDRAYDQAISASHTYPQAAPGIPLPPTRPTVPTIPRAPTMGGIGGGGGRGFNRDMSMDMPDSQRPYPGAREQNWGQSLARSPWMSLVAAGSKMATTTGPIGSVIGAGIGAGAGELEKQRKELQSEEGINQKAQQLYQTAKQHLDKYQRKTPHELATEQHQAQSLALSKYTPVTYVDGEGKSRVGVFDTKRGIVMDPQTRQPVSATNIIQRPQSDIEGRINQRAKLYMSSVPPMSPAEALAKAREDIAGPMNQNTAAAKPTPSAADLSYLQMHPEAREGFIKKFGFDPGASP